MATKTTKSAAKKSKPKVATGKLAVGDKAPAFALADQTGATHKLADHKGRKVLIYFYPKADTPGCTTQSCSVRDARKDFAKQGVDVLGISPDKPTAQRKFDTKYGLGFPLLADEDHAVAEAFGVWGEKSMYGRKYMGIVRSAFLIDEKGKVAGAWYGVSPKDTVPGALATLGG
jgi:peroxiredoxin Q/BCP